MEKELVNCKNCEVNFDKSFEFCPHCGQKARNDLTLGVLFYNTISNYFSFDARFFKSLIPLLIKPGFLASRFVEGKRLLYLHPAQYYLFVSVVFFFLFSFVAREQTQTIDSALKKDLNNMAIIDTTKVNQALDTIKANPLLNKLKDSNIITDVERDQLKTLDSIIKTEANIDKSDLFFGFEKKKLDSLIALNAPDEEIYKVIGMKDDVGGFERQFYAQMLKFYKGRSGGDILQAFYDFIPIALFILLPIFAFILKLFFYRRGRFSHHLVFSFYYFSFLFTAFSICLVANFIWDVPDWIDFLIVLSTFFYLYLAIKRFYRHGYILSFIKTGMVTFLYMCFVIPIAVVIMFIAAFMFY